MAGGTWPERARVAAVALVAATWAGEGSLGVRLLTDLRAVFNGECKLPTATVLERLHDLDEAPWSELGKQRKPLNARGLARMLNAYDVHPKYTRDGAATFRGYDRDDLADPWARYITAAEPIHSSGRQTIMKVDDVGPPAQGTATSATRATDRVCEVCSGDLAEADLLVGARVHGYCERQLQLVPNREATR